MINKLDSTTVRKISSGQLILDIPSTLKELIENSLDASSSQITLTLEDEGLTSITVPSLKHFITSVETTDAEFPYSTDPSSANATQPVKSPI
jgi:DNA mismatch repair protein MutL